MNAPASYAAWATFALAVVTVAANWLISQATSRARIGSIEQQMAGIVTTMAAGSKAASDSLAQVRDEFEERISDLVKSMDAETRELRGGLKQVEVLIDQKHERLRHDYNNIQQHLIVLIEEKGRNDARQEEFRGAMQSILRRIDGHK